MLIDGKVVSTVDLWLKTIAGATGLTSEQVRIAIESRSYDLHLSFNEVVAKKCREICNGVDLSTNEKIKSILKGGGSRIGGTVSLTKGEAIPENAVFSHIEKIDHHRTKSTLVTYVFMLVNHD